MMNLKKLHGKQDKASKAETKQKTAGQTCSTFNTDPASVVSKTETALTIAVKQTWKVDSSLGWIAAQYMENGSIVCEHYDDVGGLTELTYTAGCRVDGFAAVDIYVHDQDFSELKDNAVAPATF